MSPEIHHVWAAWSFMFGAIVGSFLNVVIIRLPEGKSVVFPSSRCPSCRKEIRFYDNIPILSYFILLGRCRNCGARFSIRYPAVEFLTACLSLALFWRFGLSAELVVFFLFCAAMVVVFWIDLDHMIIPDVISLNGLAVGMVAASAGLLEGMNWKLSVGGALMGGAILYFPAVIYEKIRGIEGLGGGDIKLLAMIGAFTGPFGVIFVLFLSSLAGTLFALFGMAVKGTRSTTPIPFGPFLTTAAVFYVFAAPWVIPFFHGAPSLF